MPYHVAAHGLLLSFYPFRKLNAKRLRLAHQARTLGLELSEQAA